MVAVPSGSSVRQPLCRRGQGGSERSRRWGRRVRFDSGKPLLPLAVAPDWKAASTHSIRSVLVADAKKCRCPFASQMRAPPRGEMRGGKPGRVCSWLLVVFRSCVGACVGLALLVWSVVKVPRCPPLMQRAPTRSPETDPRSPIRLTPSLIPSHPCRTPETPSRLSQRTASPPIRVADRTQRTT